MTLKKSQSSGPEADMLILGLANAVTVHPVCQEELYNPGRDVSINPNENSILTPQRPVPDVRLGYTSSRHIPGVRENFLAADSQSLGLSASGARGQITQVPGTGFYTLEWTSVGPKSNLVGGLIPGSGQLIDSTGMIRGRWS